MALARYWRVINLESYSGAALELTEFHLLDEVTRVDAGVTLTSNFAPTTGMLASLQDDDTSTGVSWTSPKGVILNWDFGVATKVDNIRLGSSSDGRGFLLRATVEWSNDNLVWSIQQPFFGIKYPGPRTKTSNSLGYLYPPAHDPNYLQVVRHLRFDGVGGSTQIKDTSGREWVGGAGTAEISNAQSVAGGGSLWVSGGFISAVSTPDAVINADPATIEFFFFPTRYGVQEYLLRQGTDGTYLSGWAIQKNSSDIISIFFSDAGGPMFVTSPSNRPVAINEWHHIAVCKTDRSVTLFLDGIPSPTVLLPRQPVENTSNITIGGSNVSGAIAATFTGYIDEVRITKGVERYMGEFDPFSSDVTGFRNLVSLNLVQGRAEPRDVSLVLSAGANYPYSGVQTRPVYRARYDFTFKGDGRIAGTVKETGAPDMPVHRKVRLIREKDGLLIREQWSDKVTGEYEFKDIELGYVYTVISYDHTGAFRAVVADRLEPEIAP